MAERRGRILQSSIDQVLQRSDLAEIASAYTQLRRSSGEMQGRCPFHDERTPSFWVNAEKGLYHCFGCGAAGDVVTFVQEKLGYDFVEAIEYLADRFNVTLEHEDGGGRNERQVSKRRLYELAGAAARYYEAYLWKSASAAHARAYLSDRHVADETIRAFQLGYSPDDNSLAAKARQKGFSTEELGEARLITSNGRDFFRGRLMVPIIDRADRVLGFGARKLREEQFGGKYINSADGPLFHKKQTVFLAPGIREAAQGSEEVLVVEGYMDVIALWQAGWKHSCAVMGTALTDEQVRELKRLAPRALFAFDPDAAGQAATLRALEQARKADLEVRIVLLGDGDPADIVTGPDGRERMEELLGESVSLLHYTVSALLGSEDVGTEGGRERLWRKALEFFATIPQSPERKRQIDRVAFGLGLETSEVEMLQRATGAGARTAAPRTAPAAGRAGSGMPMASHRLSPAQQVERSLLAVAWRVGLDAPDRLRESRVLPEHFSLGAHGEMWRLLVSGDDGDPLDRQSVREDPVLAPLAAELRMPPKDERVTSWSDAHADRDTLLRELELRVEDQFVRRLMQQVRERMQRDADDDSLPAEYAGLLRRHRDLESALAEASGSE